jgi:hypothetical protein
MPLVRIPGPFDHPDFSFGRKHDDFLSVEDVDGSVYGVVVMHQICKTRIPHVSV